MIGRIEKDLTAAEKEIRDRLRLLDMDRDGRISATELQHALNFLHEKLGDEELQSLFQRLKAVDGTIDVASLMDLSREYGEKPKADD